MLITIFLTRTIKVIYAPVEISHVLCEIKSGDSARSITQKLSAQGVIQDEFLFRILVRYYKLDRTLKAGLYLFSGSLNMLDILNKIVSGEILVEKVVIPEGVSLYRTLKIITDTGIGNYNRLLQLALDPLFAERLTGFGVSNLEGFLYPDTYIFGYEMTEESILITMVTNFFSKLQQTHIDITDSNDFYQKLILASIVEREALFSDEKPRIAGVYMNRLKKGMRLQADPTVNYHLEQDFISKNRVTYSDTRNHYPHNTYVISGLPPSPICSPSVSSIFSVFYPEKNNHLFFFADRSGRHIFTETYTEHMQKQRDRNK